MALNINGRMKVKTLRADFKKEFGLALRVYDGRSFADDDATLASIRKGDSVGGEFSPQRNTKVGNLEDKIMDMFGIKTQVAGSDDSYLCDNDYTLAKALEADEKLMVKREKRGDKVASSMSAKDEISDEVSDDKELTEEEKKWMDDLWSLDDAPESIRSSKRFMLEAMKEDSSAIEHASDVLKKDSQIAMVLIALLNEEEKNSDDFRARLSAVAYLDAVVFSNESVINEMIAVSPHRYIAELLQYHDDPSEIFDTLLQFNQIIAPALKKEFENNMDTAAALVESDDEGWRKCHKVEQSLGIYDMNNLIYNSNFELDKALYTEIQNNGYIETPLWAKLKTEVQSKVFEPMKEKASSFEDYKCLINMSILNGYYKLYTYYPDNKEMLEELYMELLNYLDEADSDDLMNVYFDEPDYFEINSELPEIAEKIMVKIGEKLLALDDEEMIETLNNFEGCGGTSKVLDLPSDVKEKFLEKIESLSDEEKEEIYELDEIVENLKG